MKMQVLCSASSVPCDPFYATDSYWDYRHLFEAVEENRMYKVPHMHTHEQIRARHRRIEADLEREEQLHEKYAPPAEILTDVLTFAYCYRLRPPIAQSAVEMSIPYPHTVT